MSWQRDQWRNNLLVICMRTGNLAPRHLNFGNLGLRCPRLLLPVPRPPHSQCFPSPKIAAHRPIIYCENSLRGDDWLYKQLVSRLRPIGWALQQVRLLRLRGDFNAAPAQAPAFTFRRVRGAAQLGINPVWGFLLQLEWRDAGSGSGRLGRAGSYRGPTGPPLMQSYSSASLSLSDSNNTAGITTPDSACTAPYLDPRGPHHFNRASSHNAMRSQWPAPH